MSIDANPYSLCTVTEGIQIFQACFNYSTPQLFDWNGMDWIRSGYSAHFFISSKFSSGGGGLRLTPGKGDKEKKAFSSLVLVIKDNVRFRASRSTSFIFPSHHLYMFSTRILLLLAIGSLITECVLSLSSDERVANWHERHQASLGHIIIMGFHTLLNHAT
ncbi:hypothetical protein ACJX0J_009115, partial [Zea mays]